MKATTLISGLVRTLARRRLARMRLHAENPRGPQEQVLRQLLSHACNTEFGRDHQFSKIRTVREYQHAVPSTTYSGLEALWKKSRTGCADVCWPGQIEYFALSSGTTKGEKYLPISREAIRTNRQGGWDSIVPHLAMEPRADLFSGKLLFLGGSTTLRREDSVWVGDNTGIMARHVPRILRRFHSPGYDVASETVWERKVTAAAQRAWNQDIRMMSGVPSWLILFAEQVLACAHEHGHSVKTLSELWPQLNLLVHGGVSFEPYRKRMRALVGRDIWCTDTYSATEGGMLAVQDRENEPGMIPLVDRGAFWELIPVEELHSRTPIRLTLADVEMDRDYAVLLTTNAGIWSCLVGDVVRFISRNPLRLVFAGRTAHTLNAFGEHISSGELDRAIVAAARRFDFILNEYTVSARFPNAASPRGAHIYYLEIENTHHPIPWDLVAREIDSTLSAGNEDYAAHRSTGFGLDLPEIRPVPPGSFLAWMRSRGKLGGQHKIPRVLTPELEQNFTGVLESAHR